jgi:hypothetical protein
MGRWDPAELNRLQFLVSPSEGPSFFCSVYINAQDQSFENAKGDRQISCKAGRFDRKVV